MRTKTLLIAVAALAAGILASSAQTYSQNVVGYINASCPAGAYVLLSNPLDDGTNTTTSLGQNLPNKSVIQIWNGTGFTASLKGSGVWTPDLSIPVGTGFFVNAKTATNITFVGNVVAPSGGSATNVNAFPAGAYVLVGAQIPVSGDLNDTILNLGPTLPNKSVVQVYTGSGFAASLKGSGVWTPNQTIGVAQGVFVEAKTATNWVQQAPF